MKADMYLKRLYVLALFHQRWELIEQMYQKKQEFHCHEANSTVKHFYWALKPLPKIFPRQWHLNDQSFPYLETKPGLNALGAAAQFFGLSGEELFALFVPNHPFYPYNLRGLPENARPGAIAHQIYWFMIQKQKSLNLELDSSKV